MAGIKEILNKKDLKITGAPVIVVSFLMLAGVVTALDINMPEKRLETVSAAEFAENVVNNKKILLIDVRTPEEFNQWHLPGAKNIDYESPDFESKISELDIKTPYAIYCRSGRRSAEALALMGEREFNWVLDLLGGIEALIYSPKAMEYFE